MVHVVPCLSDCHPRMGKTGNGTQSVKLLVKEFYQGMSNMYSYRVKQISKATHVVNSNTFKVTLDLNVDEDQGLFQFHVVHNICDYHLLAL